MNNKTSDLKAKARFAGLLYLIIAVCGFYGIMYVSGQIHVSEDPEATFNNLLSKEFLFRTGIFTHLLNTIVFTMMALVFYQMFRHISEFLSLLMVALVVLHISFEYGSEALNLAAILVAKGELMESLGLVQRQELVYLLLRTSKYASVGLAIAFWGLWLIPLGVLVYWSGFIPRIFGVLLVLGGAAYLIESIDFILFPGPRGLFLSSMFVVYAAAEISFMLWLLVMGARVGIPAAHSDEK